MPEARVYNAGLRRVRFMAWVCGLAWLFYALRFLVVGAWGSSLADLVPGLLNLGLAGAAATLTKPRLDRLGHGLIAANAIGLFLAVPFTGALDSNAGFFFPCVALMAFHHLPWRPASAWTVATMVGLVLSYQLPAPALPTYQPGTLDLLLDGSTAILVTGSLAFAARRIHDEQARALEQARARADLALEAKERLLATVGHELRTPLVGTLGSAELLQRELDDPEHLRRVRTIIQCCASLQELLDDLLDQAALRDGATSVVPIVCDPLELVHGAAELFEDHATTKGLSIRVEGSCPRVVIDARRLRQVLLNLIGNAVKFTPSGSVVIRVEHQDERLQIEVRDTGIGIEDTRRVLEPFEQDAPETNQRYGGTGLGLSISRGLLQLMGGDLELHSRPGEGTRAFGWLRAPRANAVAKRVLVVEDNPVSARLTEEMLRKLGHEPTRAETLSAARLAAREGSFDIVLLDLRLPDGRGLDLLPELEGTERVVAVTANPEEKRATEEAGVPDFLTKPFRLDELEAILSA